MKNLIDCINENSNPYAGIENMVETWLNKVENVKWMHEVLDAVIKGMQNSIKYRESIPSAKENLFKKATEVLNEFVETNTKK